MNRLLALADIAKCAVQRLVRGWDDRAVWSLDHHLTGTLGRQLLALAAHGKTVPSGYNPDGATWARDLTDAGQALLRYSHAIAIADPTPATIEAAQDALHWVADNLPTLWD